MLPFLADLLCKLWGPFRLFNSHLVLIVLGACISGFATWLLLPRLWKFLPRDQGKPFVKDSEQAQGKPTGAGIIFVSSIILTLILVIPFSFKIWGVLLCLFASMLTGYLDDASEVHWGELKKGLLDLVVTAATAAILSEMKSVEIWFPLIKGPLPGGAFLVPFWLYWPCATGLLWLSINVVNCSDGVDGLAGSLSLGGLMAMGAFMYGIIGHEWIAKYLLVPHDIHGAIWAIVIFTAAGSLAGYLWYNAWPSAVLMGDAGSRFLGLLVGLTALTAHNPFVILVAAPLLCIDGGVGLIKLTFIRICGKLGLDVRPPLRNYPHAIHPEKFASDEDFTRQILPIRILHSFRCPLHDHCRRSLKWSDPQILVRFNLIQIAALPVLLLILIKLR